MLSYAMQYLGLDFLTFSSTSSNLPLKDVLSNGVEVGLFFFSPLLWFKLLAHFDGKSPNA